ncbi:MAG: hypothetical protein IKV59_10425, partial [Lachnospiraceae bacterium]|nr:hypothetical protein [Lachnospiraceae bacterium]
MPLVPAICTQCGAQIEVDNTHEAGICKHCGTAFITEKAINNYTTNITHHHHFDGATVHMNVESELERLVTAADTFRKMGQNYNAARNYSEIFQKYPQDPRGWIGFIYTHDRYKDFFEAPPKWKYTYAHFSGQNSPRWDKSLVNDHYFKTAWQVADPDTKQQLTELAEQYIKNCSDYEKQIQQKTAEHKANYSLEGLKRYIGDDIYLYQCTETSLDLLYILDDKLYFQNIYLHDSSKNFSHTGVLGELTSMDNDGTIHGQGIYCSNTLELRNLDYYEDDCIVVIHDPSNFCPMLDHRYDKIPNGSKEYDRIKGFIS